MQRPPITRSALRALADHREHPERGGAVLMAAAMTLFAAVFVLVSLSLLKVAAAFLLAVLAGVCDFVPILGFFVALTPAVLLALSIPPGTAVLQIISHPFIGIQHKIIWR